MHALVKLLIVRLSARVFNRSKPEGTINIMHVLCNAIIVTERRLRLRVLSFILSLLTVIYHTRI